MRKNELNGRSVKTLLLTGSAILLLSGVANAQSSTHVYNIPAENASNGLNDFAHQSGLSILFPYDVVSHKQTPMISGQMTEQDALSKMLAHTGLVVGSRENGVVILVAARSATIIPASAVSASGNAAAFDGPMASGPSAPMPAAQDAPAASQMAAPKAAAPANDSTTVVVTGSRILRNGYKSPTPTLITTAEELQATSPQSITQGLEKLPIFAASDSQAGTGAHGLGSGAVNEVGSFLNLRDFGSDYNTGALRTLILLDGHRVPSTDATGLVDVDTLPQALVQRVDVVTGGASAVYGSDAVTGVVNYVLDHKFNGLKGLAQYGESTYHDDDDHRYQLTWGSNLFGGRGHVEVSGEVNESAGVPTKESRPWYHDQFLTGAGTPASPYYAVNNGVINTASFGGLITSVGGGASSSLVNQQFEPNGTLAAFNKGITIPTSGYGEGGDGTYHIDTSLLASLKQNKLFGRFDYDLSDDVHFWAQASYDDGTSDHTQATANRTTSGTSGIRIYSGNPYLTPAENALIPAGGYINVSEYGLGLGRPVFEIITKSTLFETGLTGTIFDNRWHWDATYSYGRGETRQNQYNDSTNVNFYAAVDAVTNPANGQIVCRVSLTQYANLYPGCVPINPLGLGNASAAAIAYTTNLTWYDAVNETNDFSVNASGDLFNNWAGPVSVAVGAEYRDQTLNETTSNDPNALPDFAGLRGDFILQNANQCSAACTPAGINAGTYTLAYVGALAAASHGDQDVKEANVEVLFPLLTDVRFAESLNLTGALRYTDYKTSGGATTWKIGADWQPYNDLRFRAVESRDIRAPTLYDLYAGAQIASKGLTDPLTGVSGYPRQYTEGNPNLVPEVANTSTLGFVYSPSFVPGLSGSVDWYAIKVKNAISSIAITDLITQCDNSGGTSALCNYIQRPINNTNTTAANFPTSYEITSFNAAYNYTTGVDVDVSYRRALDRLVSSWKGTLGVRVLYSYQPHDYIQALPTSVRQDYAGVADYGFAKNRVTTQINYTLGDFNASIDDQWKGKLHRNAIYTTLEPELPSYNLVDLNLSYDWHVDGGTVQTFLTGDNIFNENPRIFANNAIGQVTPVAVGDDVVGRYITAGIRFKY